MRFRPAIDQTLDGSFFAGLERQEPMIGKGGKAVGGAAVSKIRNGLARPMIALAHNGIDTGRIGKTGNDGKAWAGTDRLQLALVADQNNLCAATL